MTALIFIAGIGLGLVSMLWVPQYIVGPIDRAARNLQAPLQFSLVDFLALVFLVQLPTGLISYYVGNVSGFNTKVMYGFGWIATSLLWYAGVRALSAAAIVNPWHRVFFFCFIGPTAVGSVWSLSFAGIAMVVTLFKDRELGKLLLLMSINLLTLAAIALAAWLSRYIVRSRETVPVANVGRAIAPTPPTEREPVELEPRGNPPEV